MMKKIALCLSLVFAMPCAAQVPDDLAVGTLLPGWWDAADGSYIAAVRITMHEGWKTYWRAPGDNGIPPQFDWRAAQNLREASPLWPAPQIIDGDDGFYTLGYANELVLPIRLRPQDSAQPVIAAFKMDIGVCKDICVPVSLDFNAALHGQGAHDPVIGAALDYRPRDAARGDVLAYSCAITPTADGLDLRAQIAIDALGDKETIAIEVDDPRVWVVADASRRMGGNLVAQVTLMALDTMPMAIARDAITLTIVGTQRGAVEIKGCPAP